VNATFDYLDAFYLANTLTLPELRQEIKHAKNLMEIDNFYSEYPCFNLWRTIPLDKRRGTFELNLEGIKVYDNYYNFDWEGYIKVCEEAAEAIRNHDKQYPQTTLPGKRIDIEGIKARSDIVAIIEGYTKLRKSGNNRFTGQCPLHEDKHPSMTVYADNQSWHCFQCNKGGDIFDFIMAVNSCDFKRAATTLGAT
jgi:hypothetical protein